MTKFKRYVRNVYPIAGLRWVNETGLNDEDGVLFSMRKTNNSTNRSQIEDDQHMIKWSALKKAIQNQVVNPIAKVISLVTTPPIPVISIYKGLINGKLSFNQIGAGEGIVFVQEDGYIEIKTDTYENKGFPLPKHYTFQIDLMPPLEGKLVYNRDTKQLNWGTGIEWKSTNV